MKKNETQKSTQSFIIVIFFLFALRTIVFFFLFCWFAQAMLLIDEMMGISVHWNIYLELTQIPEPQHNIMKRIVQSVIVNLFHPNQIIYLLLLKGSVIFSMELDVNFPKKIRNVKLLKSLLRYRFECRMPVLLVSYVSDLILIITYQSLPRQRFGIYHLLNWFDLSHTHTHKQVTFSYNGITSLGQS